MTTVRVGMVGLGLAFSAHFKGYDSHPQARIAAICDKDQARARDVARLHGIDQVYSNYDDMLADANIDLVDIATPTFLHASMTQKAAEAGKHIHCEKPFCRNVGEGLAAVKAAHRNEVKLLVGETYVFLSGHMKARELIEAGEIGRPLQIRQRHGAWQARIYTGPLDRAWRVNPKQSGGGAYPWIYDHAVHFFATAEYLMLNQKIDEVYAVVASGRDLSQNRGAAHDPYQTAEVDIPIISWSYEDVSCQGVWMRAEPLNGKYDYMRGFSTIIVGEAGMIEVLGEGGHNLIWAGQQQHLVLHRAGKEAMGFRFEEGGDDVWQSDIAYYSRGHVNQIHHLLDCIIEDREPRYGGEDGVQAVACTLATICSARERRPVKVSEIAPDYTAY